MSGSDVWELITGVIIVAIIYVLARPGSPAAGAIASVSNALSGLVSTATNQSTEQTV